MFVHTYPLYRAKIMQTKRKSKRNAILFEYFNTPSPFSAQR